MNAEPHETAWQIWSASERARLLALPHAELLLAVQTGALDNLVEEDAKAVLTALAGFKSALPAFVRTSGRQPEAFMGRAQFPRPRLSLRMQLSNHAGLIALASALALWAVVLWAGGRWLTLNSFYG